MSSASRRARTAPAPAVRDGDAGAAGVASAAAWGRFEWAVGAFVLLPVLAAVVRALAEGWIPMGENAVFPLRARDVLTANHPWLGTFSSASLTSDTIVNHPGPLLFDVLAIPVRLLGPAAGTVVGIAAINTTALCVALRAARATGGRRWFVAVALGAVGLEWTLGSSLLIDPWNPHVLVLPWFALLVSAIALISGWRHGLVWIVVLGSLAIQTHVSYALQVPLVLVAALALAGVASWVRGGSARDVRAALTRWRRPAAVAAAWGVALWAQPLWQQVAGSGPGNLSALLRTAREEQARAGWSVALRLVARVVALPPWWMRSSFTDSLRDLRLRDEAGADLPLAGWVPSMVVALAGLLVVLGLLAGVVLLGWRSRRRDIAAPAAVSGVALVVGVWSASSIPASGYGVAPHQLRWLWPVAVLWMIAVGQALVVLVGERPARLAPDHARPGPGVSTLLRAVPAVVVVAGALHACVGYHQPVGVARAPGSQAAVEDLSRQVAAADFPPVVLDNGGMWIGEPFTGPILERSYRDGSSRVTVDAVQAAQVGRGRLVTDEVAARLHLRWGAAALVCPADGSRRIALTTAQPPEVVAAVVAGVREAARIVETLGLVADEASMAEAPDVAAAFGDAAAIQELVLSGRLAEVVRTTSLGTWLSDEDRLAIDELAAVSAPIGVDTVAVFVGPRDPSVTWGTDEPLAAAVAPASAAVACP